MRFLIPLLMMVLVEVAAAEPPVPVLELTWDGQPIPLAGPVAAWWRESLDEAAAWGSRASGVPVQRSDAECRGLRLLAASVGEPGRRRAAWAGWCRGASPGLTAALTGLVARWPGCTAAQVDGRLAFASDGLVAPDEAPAAGWRMRLHGRGAAIEAEEMIGEAAAPWIQRLAQAWQLEARVEADGTGRIDIAPFVPPFLASLDEELVARLPAGALVLAVALDPAQVARIPLLAEELSEELPRNQRDPEALRAFGGSWALVVEPDGTWLLIGPRSPALDLVLRRKGARLPPALTWKDYAVIGAPAGHALWEQGPAAGAGCRLQSGTAALAVLACDPGLLGTGELRSFRGEFLPVLEHLPLVARVLGPGPREEGRARDLGLAIASSETLTAGLAAAGPQHLRLSAVPGGVRIDLTGSLLPWLLPAAALRWFADAALDQEGRRSLRQAIAELHAAGAVAVPDDLLAGLAKPAEAETQALVALLADLGATTLAGRGPQNDSLAGQGLPWRPEAEEELADLVTARGLLVRSARLTPDLPLRAALLHRSASQGRLSFLRETPEVAAARILARAGRLLALAGDPEGLDLVDRALILTRHPDSLLQGLVAMSVAAMRDDAHLALALLERLPEGRRQAWLEEAPPAGGTALGWPGERALGAGWLAQRWLGERPPEPDAAGAEGLGLAGRPPLVLMPSQHRAWTAGDLATLMRLTRQYELDGLPPVPPLPRSLIGGILQPAFTMVGENGLRARLRHQLVRVACRLPPLARSLPPGMESLPIPGGRLPLLIEARGRGFRLGVDASGERPTAISESLWRSWQGPPAPPGTSCALPGRSLEVVWEQPLPPDL